MKRVFSDDSFKHFVNKLKTTFAPIRHTHLITEIEILPDILTDISKNKMQSYKLVLSDENLVNNQFLTKIFSDRVINAMKDYLNNGDFNKEASLLENMSCAKIIPVLKMEFKFDSAGNIIHMQHFKPWTIHFYDKISGPKCSFPVFDIEIQDDAAKFLSDFGISKADINIKYIRLDMDVLYKNGTCLWWYIAENGDRITEFTFKE